MTPAVAFLQRAGATFTIHTFDGVSAWAADDYGRAVASAIGLPPERVCKTLLATVDGHPVVAVVPVAGRLSVKALAAARHGKRAELMAPADAERLTGYVVGGISPFGQRKRLPTVLDAGAATEATIAVSGGKRGIDLELAPSVLVELLGAQVAPLAE